MDTHLAHEAQPRHGEAASEGWFPDAICGTKKQQERRAWLDERTRAAAEKRTGYLIDPLLLQYVVNNDGRMPTPDDQVKPWEYKGWMLLVVQKLHERIANYRLLQELCTYTGEEMPFEWKRRIDPELSPSKRAKKSNDGETVLGPPIIVPRWHYLFKTLRAGRLLDESIPQIHFYSSYQGQPKQVLGQLEKWVRLIERDGVAWSALTSFIEWLGWALGVHDEPSKLRADTQLDLYRVVDLVPMMEWPSDYLGDLASERFGGGPNAFYPTPHSVVEMMSQMVAHDVKLAGRDSRAETVLDCCLGTGRMLLHASNYSLRLHGQDIDWFVLLCAKINFALYAPWAIAPLPEEYFSANPPGPPWQLEDQYRQDCFFDDHLRHYKQLWSLKQLFKLARGEAPEEVSKPEIPVLDEALDEENAEKPDVEAAPAQKLVPVIPPDALAVPGVISLSAPNEQRRESVSPEAVPIPLSGVQLGLFGFASEEPKKSKKKR